MLSNSSHYFGVIDSGVGGLTVLRQLESKYPNCAYVYFADTAYCPYGTKEPSEILHRVETVVDYLLDIGAGAIVLACNTASVFADTLRSRYSVPIYDVIAPTCKLVSNVTRSKRVALLATNATIKSHAYQDTLNALGIAVVAFPCSSFVPFVEANAVDTPECEQAIREALHTLPHCNVDTVILGCTHFPVLRKKIAPYVSEASIVECVTDFRPFSFSVVQQRANTVYLTSGCQQTVNAAAKFYTNARFVHVDC